MIGHGERDESSGASRGLHVVRRDGGWRPVALRAGLGHHPRRAGRPGLRRSGLSSLCSFSGINPDCPAFPPPPPLLNPGAVAAAGGEVGAFLERLQDQAVDNTLADHGLPESDRAAVLSWGRDDAHAELWALIVQAINTPAAERTADQQNAAAWIMRLASAQANDAAKQTGAEYATWAGLDVTDYERMADTASKDQLTAFLSEDVRSFSPLFTPNGGYCRYRPPAPFAADYDGSRTQTCFVPCSFLACVIPTPKYDDFVKWGRPPSRTARSPTPASWPRGHRSPRRRCTPWSAWPPRSSWARP